MRDRGFTLETLLSTSVPLPGLPTGAPIPSDLQQCKAALPDNAVESWHDDWLESRDRILRSLAYFLLPLSRRPALFALLAGEQAGFDIGYAAEEQEGQPHAAVLGDALAIRRECIAAFLAGLDNALAEYDWEGPAGM